MKFHFVKFQSDPHYINSKTDGTASATGCWVVAMSNTNFELDACFAFLDIPGGRWRKRKYGQQGLTVQASTQLQSFNFLKGVSNHAVQPPLLGKRM